jgi:hypothetical protein
VAMNTPSVPPATTTSYMHLLLLPLPLPLLLLLLPDLTDLLGDVFTNCGAGPAAAPVCKQTPHSPVLHSAEVPGAARLVQRKEGFVICKQPAGLIIPHDAHAPVASIVNVRLATVVEDSCTLTAAASAHLHVSQVAPSLISCQQRLICGAAPCTACLRLPTCCSRVHCLKHDASQVGLSSHQAV